MIRLVYRDSAGQRVTTLPRWAVWAGVGAAVVLGLLILTVSLTVLVLLAPVAIGAGLLARWRLKKALQNAFVQDDADRRARPFARPPQGGVIDGEYRVVDEPRRPGP